MNRIIRKKVFVTQKEYNEAIETSKKAQELLNEPSFKFFRDYLQESLKSIEDKVLNNTVREVKEVVTISKVLKKIFTTPKKEQIQEMSGVYKWINKMIQDLSVFSDMAKDLGDRLESGQVVIRDEEVSS